MRNISTQFKRLHRAVRAVSFIALCAGVTACGGDGSAPADGSAVNTTALTLSAQPGEPAPDAIELRHAFHVAPVVLDDPGDADAQDNSASTRQAPRRQPVPTEMSDVPTRGLTAQRVERLKSERVKGLSAAQPGTSSKDSSIGAAPAATATFVSTYTPAQIRAAYGLPALPATGVTPTAQQRAQMGAGQTIYIVDAMHDPNVAAELSAFNQKFGLPTCTLKPIATTTPLPLAPAAPADNCVLSVVYSTPSGAMTTAAPAYHDGWATEIALDVQWAHATAPLARIVLIEAPDASVNSLVNAIKLANAMGPGAVSMSFGANEGSWGASLEQTFTGAGMSYLAATGDWGAQVAWPAVSPKVVAVGGTTLVWSGSGARSETGWAQTGGGLSAFMAAPAYQSINVPGVGGLRSRGVADVAFNADPNTGQYLAVIKPGSTAVQWLSAGGTSLSTPQWAGLMAIANALRVQAAKTRLGTPHDVLYGAIGAVPGNYAASFADIKIGSNGSCTACSAVIGYDELTGLGTPNVGALLNLLTGAAVAAPTPPVVKGAAIAGTAGKPLSFAASVSATNKLSFALGGAPAGMTIDATGNVSWPLPVAGNYSVTVVATDSVTRLVGQGVYTISIAPAAAPVISAASITGVAGKPLSASIPVSDPNGFAMTIGISGAPAGMSFSAGAGKVAVAWGKPVTGQYTLTVSARNTAGATASVRIAVAISAK